VVIDDRENKNKNIRLCKLQQGVSGLLRMKQCYINRLILAMDVMLSSVANHYLYGKKVLFFDHAQHIPLRTKTITGIILEK